MLKSRNKNYFILFLTVLIAAVFLTPAAAAGDGRIEDMNFKGADIRDVLRTIAEISETNLVIDDSVRNSITIHLSDITFKKALDMITTAHHLDYKWDDNIIVVAPPERMQDIYGKVETRVIAINDPELEQVKKITNEIYPELNIQINQRKNQLIIQGKEEMINKAVGLINEIKYVDTDKSDQDKTDDRTAEAITEIIKVEPENLNMIEENVRNIYPDVRVAKNENNHQLILHGQEKNLEKAASLIEKIDLPVNRENEEQIQVTEIIEIESREPATILDNIRNIYDELRLSQNNNLIIINGREENVNRALALVEKLDVPVAEDKENNKQDEEMVTRVVNVNRENTGSIYNSVSNIYGELKLAQNEDAGQIVLHGNQELVNKALTLIEEMDRSPAEEEKEIDEEDVKETGDGASEDVDKVSENSEEADAGYMEVVNLENSDLNKLKNEINAVKPDLRIQVSQIYQQLLIRGPREEVQEAKSMALEYDENQKVVTRMIRVDYADIENVISIVGNLYGEVNLQINNKVREIIVKGREKDVNEAVSLIKDLDISRQQVIIEARVEEISSTELSEIGINPGSFSRIHFIRENAGEGGSAGFIKGVELTWPEFLDAMRREGTAETLANPHLMTLNGENAKLLIGQRIPVKTLSSSGEESIKYIEAGISLNFKPWITEDGSIELEIQPKVSSLGEEIYSGYPSIKTREVDTSLRLQDGETLAIGGLIQEDVSENVAKVPLLSEIPILGELFKNRNKETSKTELLIFITPRIVQETQKNGVENGEENTALTDKEEKNADKPINDENDEDLSAEVESQENIEEKEVELSAVEMPQTGGEIQDLSKEELQIILNESRKSRNYTGEQNLPLYLNILYRVKHGETLKDIADTYGISEKSIQFVNYLEEELKEDDLITIPIPQDHLYRLQEGETLWQISQKMDIDVEKLEEINNIEDVADLPVGFIVIFPRAIR